MMTQRNKVVVALLLCASILACGKKLPVLIGQSGYAATKTIEVLTDTGKNLEQQGILPTQHALTFQTRLQTLNTKAESLPGLVRAIDAAEKAGTNPDASVVQKALAIVQVLIDELPGTVKGIPVDGAAKQLLDAVNEGVKTLTTFQFELAKLKAALNLQPVEAK